MEGCTIICHLIHIFFLMSGTMDYCHKVEVLLLPCCIRRRGLRLVRLTGVWSRGGGRG